MDHTCSSCRNWCTFNQKYGWCEYLATGVSEDEHPRKGGIYPYLDPGWNQMGDVLRVMTDADFGCIHHSPGKPGEVQGKWRSG